MNSKGYENISIEKKLINTGEKKDIKYNESIAPFLKACLIIVLLVEFIVDIYYIKSSTQKYNHILDNPNLERFYSVLPSFIRSNSNGFFETNRNGLKEIPINKINYKREESCFIQKIELNQMSNIAGNIDISLLADIAIFHSDVNFKTTINEHLEKTEKLSSFVVKYISGYMTINTEDIKLKDSFKNKIEQISNENEYSDENKAIELDKLFNSYGYYIPQKIYLGGSFIIELSDIEIDEKNGLSIDISGKIDITNVSKINGTSKSSYNNILNFLNKAQKTVIIGGNKNTEQFEDWKSSINMDNIEVVSYANIIEITNILDDRLKSKLKKPLDLIEKKYNLRKRYYEIIEELKNTKRKKDITVSKFFSEGICEIENQLIYSKNIPIREKWAFKDKDFNFQESYPHIIIGWEIKSLESFNGKCTLEESPILKKEIKFNFVRQFYIFGSKYDIVIYLMKYPD